MNNDGKKWLAAVSAGPDSMALLSMSLEHGIIVEAAHVNYHHRKEADEEEQYVRSFCREHGIVLHVLNDPFEYEGNFEAAARVWRYDYFAKVVKERKLSGVLVAHHMDDLIETWLMQKERGLVPAYYGLKEEMIYKGMVVRRPLLSYRKKDLLQYCRDHQIRYYIDSTNLLDDNRRNYLRHHVVEQMSDAECTKTVEFIKKENQMLEETRKQACVLIQNGKINIRAYRHTIEDVRLAAMRMLVDQKCTCTLAFMRQCDEIVMKRDDFMIRVHDRNLVSDHEWMFTSDLPESYSFVFQSAEEVIREGKQKYFCTSKGRCGVNAVTVGEEDFPVTIRNFRDGDAIEMRFGTKKVNRFFIDRHIPLYQRKTWPVLVNAAGDVILVPGLGCDCRHYSTKPDFCVIQCTL